MQAGLLYEALSGRSGNYVQQVTVTCRDSLDEDALRRAWLALIRRHGALRTSFLIGESALPRQRMHEEVDLAIVTADWRSLGDDERERRWQELLLAERQAGFEPSQPQHRRLPHKLQYVLHNPHRFQPRKITSHKSNRLTVVIRAHYLVSASVPTIVILTLSAVEWVLPFTSRTQT